MYFKKLELIGFKSFMEKTTLNFEPGLTAVVGPNGCGKSNIFDSIRWVLGEQSVKALRGSSMEDVIFNGTDTKEPLSLAEVNLTFDNEQKFFPLESKEVVITRRIFRSGESEYLLNKALVRLKDISDLLSGTGIGSESYSLVEQGKIDLVLSSRPEDRRLVFDEAAGITKYKTQKKEALRKLDDTEQNLLRVNDIITEVKRQIGSLERQANKARRYKEAFEELKTKETNMAILQKIKLIGKKDELIEQLTELEAKEAGLLSIIQEQESKINSQQEESKKLEDGIMSIKSQILNIDNLIGRNRERISFNEEKIAEFCGNKTYLEKQSDQLKERIALDEQKLSRLQQERASLKDNIEEKSRYLKTSEEELHNLGLAIKGSLENIARGKKDVLDLIIRLTQAKNEIGDLGGKHQILLSRKKRLEIEKEKVSQELGVIEDSLNKITQEVEAIHKEIQGLNLRIFDAKDELERNNTALVGINQDLEVLERKKLSFESHREFLEKLKNKYEGIGESMNAVIYVDKLPQEKLSGLVVKIKNCDNSEKLKLEGEAKPIDLDTKGIDEKINQIRVKIEALTQVRTQKENDSQELQNVIQGFEEGLRKEELAMVNKNTSRQGISEQFNKIREEGEVIAIELSDAEQELNILKDNLSSRQSALAEIENKQKEAEDLIISEQNNIAVNAESKEKVLVNITRGRTELEALDKRIISDESAFKMLEEAYNRDKENLVHIEGQVRDIYEKEKALNLEIKDLEIKIEAAQGDLKSQQGALEEMSRNYEKISGGMSQVIRKIDSDRHEMDSIKDKLYEMQMQNKDIDFQYLSLKEKMLEGYKIDLDAADEAVLKAQEIDEDLLSRQIAALKEKLDSYGTVNLVAIEEYDELKKRYDFLLEQQADLNSAKESLHEAILKINRTTKKMFLEIFERVRLEFRNYFRLLFNGGDAQVFLIDEQDPLESGIEIICRPPGKKLQNVLLLSGGEKSLSAIALIFAIFKVKPSPFCVLDEIDAALDEANVDRFGRILQEFTKFSQFIIITHNKKTIANANVMYGITMQQSGVSKIISVKFREGQERELVGAGA